MHENIKGKQTTFKITCTECSKGRELFPDGYFVSTKGNLKSGRKPCGCSKRHKWKPFQFLILARRAGEKKGFIVHDFAEEYKNQKTKLNCECLIDGHKWTAVIASILNGGHGCPACAKRPLITEDTALSRCKIICDANGYEILGFPNGYKNAHSRFEYICPKHGIQKVSYLSFYYRGSKCPLCWREKQKEMEIGFYGWYPERSEEMDSLYIVSFDNKYIKVGRSFDLEERFRHLRRVSGIDNIKVLYIYTGLHKEVYPTEQTIHRDLGSRVLRYYPIWKSNETFINKSLPILKDEDYVKTIMDHHKSNPYTGGAFEDLERIRILLGVKEPDQTIESEVIVQKINKIYTH